MSGITINRKVRHIQSIYMSDSVLALNPELLPFFICQERQLDSHYNIWSNWDNGIICMCVCKPMWIYVVNLIEINLKRPGIFYAFSVVVLASARGARKSKREKLQQGYVWERAYCHFLKPMKSDFFLPVMHEILVTIQGIKSERCSALNELFPIKFRAWVCSMFPSLIQCNWTMLHRSAEAVEIAVSLPRNVFYFIFSDFYEITSRQNSS